MLESNFSTLFHNLKAQKRLFRNGSWNTHVFTGIQRNVLASSISTKSVKKIGYTFCNDLQKHEEEIHVKRSYK